MADAPKTKSRLRLMIERRYARYTSDGKIWFTIGAGALIVDVCIGMMAGWSQATIWHGIGFGLLAAGFAFLPDAAYEEFTAGRYVPAIVLSLLTIPLGLKAFEQQVTYSAGMRHSEIQLTQIVNQRHAGAQDNVVETRTNLKLWQEQLAKLEAERAAAVAANPWMTTTTAEALRGQVPELDERIAREIAGGRGGRGKGCKTECEKLKDEKARILSQIAAIEKLDATTEKLTKLAGQIEATKKVLDGARKTADTAEHRDSLNLAVAKVTAQIVSIARGTAPAEAINADEVSIRYATLGSAGLGSFALLVLAPVGLFLAGRRRRPEDSDESTIIAPAPSPLPVGPPTREAITPQEPRSTVIHTREVIPSAALRRWSVRDEVRSLLRVA